MNITGGSISWMVTREYVYKSGTLDLCDTLPLKCPVKPGKGLMVLPNPVPMYVFPVSSFLVFSACSYFITIIETQSNYVHIDDA